MPARLRFPRWPAALLGLLVVAACSGSSDYTGPPPPTGSGSVQGVVTDGGSGVAAAGLSLSQSGQATRTTTTGADGTYSFTQVPAGTWTLTVTAPNGFTVNGSASIPVTVTDGQTATENFTVAEAVATVDSAVSVADFSFAPANVTVPVGTTVTFTNGGHATHTVTANAGAFNSGDLAPGAIYKHTFNTAGTFAYHCAIHASMVGTIVVQ